MWNSLFSERLDYSNHWKPDKVGQREYYQTYSSETFALWEVNCPGSLFLRNWISYIYLIYKSNPGEIRYFLCNSWGQHVSFLSVSGFWIKTSISISKWKGRYYILTYTFDSFLTSNIFLYKWWHIFLYLSKSIFMAAFRGLDLYTSSHLS